MVLSVMAKRHHHVVKNLRLVLSLSLARFSAFSKTSENRKTGQQLLEPQVPVTSAEVSRTTLNLRTTEFGKFADYAEFEIVRKLNTKISLIVAELRRVSAFRRYENLPAQSFFFVERTADGSLMTRASRPEVTMDKVSNFHSSSSPSLRIPAFTSQKKPTTPPCTMS